MRRDHDAGHGGRLYRLNGPIGRWFIGVSNPAHASPVKTTIAKHWFLGAMLLFALFVTADIYAAVAGQTRISAP